MPVEAASHVDPSAADNDPPPVLPPPPVDIYQDATPTWNDPVFPLNGEKPPDIILGELLLIYFEWMSAHKVTDACAEACATMMGQLMPPGANGLKWQGAQKLLTAIYNHTVVSVDICPNDCISYYDCKHPKMAHYKHAHRTWCPRCGADRKLTHKDGTIRSAKKGYYLPCGTWLRDLFKIPDLAKELNTETASSRPPGHASASRGWKQKVTPPPPAPPTTIPMYNMCTYFKLFVYIFMYVYNDLISFTYVYMFAIFEYIVYMCFLLYTFTET
jgi:hypothetical protein